MVCPHKGARLSSCKVENGCVTCPLHGLRWDTTTGSLSPVYPTPTP
ncbi:Rieske (2Fe-2S) protein [Hymenobacter sediminis]